MEEIKEVTIEHLKDGSTITFIPADIDSKTILGFGTEDMKEINYNITPIFDNQGNCIGSKFITAFEL